MLLPDVWTLPKCHRIHYRTLCCDFALHSVEKTKTHTRLLLVFIGRPTCLCGDEATDLRMWGSIRFFKTSIPAVHPPSPLLPVGWLSGTFSPGGKATVAVVNYSPPLIQRLRMIGALCSFPHIYAFMVLTGTGLFPPRRTYWTAISICSMFFIIAFTFSRRKLTSA